MKQYMTVPAPMGLVGKNMTGQQVCDMFAGLINQQAQQGWRYHSMETVAFDQAGCMAFVARLGGKDTSQTVYMMIFESGS